MSCDLTDAQWAGLQPLLPPPRPTGRPRAHDRRTFTGICYVLRPGCRWEIRTGYGRDSRWSEGETPQANQ